MLTEVFFDIFLVKQKYKDIAFHFLFEMYLVFTKNAL